MKKNGIDKTLYFSGLLKLPLGIFIVDRNYTVLFWNELMENFTGITSKNIIDKNLFDFFPNFNQKKYTMRFNWIFDGGPPAILSYQLNKDIFTNYLNEQTDKILRTTVTSVKSTEEDSFYAMFSVENITDLAGQIKEQKRLKNLALEEIENRKKVEASLVESGEQLQEINATKDKLFSIIAHDLKNPLGAFNKLLDSLMENYAVLDEDDRLEIISSIRNSSKNVYELLENLLFWSRSQRGHIKIETVQIDLIFLVNNILSLLSKVAENKYIKLVFNCPVSAYCYADVNMTHTILRNLISNAIKFTYKGGEVIVTIDTEYDENFVKISVVDSGVGMTKDVSDKLFKLDSYVSTKGTEDEKGTGLGLILCREFAEINGGKIWVESVYQEGSTFSFTLPKYPLNQE